LVLRAAVYLAISAGLAGLLVVLSTVRLEIGNTEIFGVFQGVEAAANIVVLVGAALFFTVSLETRLKRGLALKDLHVFRSIAHVIDMHQLTKDPSLTNAAAPATGSSPRRTMD